MHVHVIIDFSVFYFQCYRMGRCTNTPAGGLRYQPTSFPPLPNGAPSKYEIHATAGAGHRKDKKQLAIASISAGNVRCVYCIYVYSNIFSDFIFSFRL